jgi:hypothetical protein
MQFRLVLKPAAPKQSQPQSPLSHSAKEGDRANVLGNLSLEALTTKDPKSWNADFPVGLLGAVEESWMISQEKPIKALQLSSTAASQHAIWQRDGKQPVLMQVCQHLQVGPNFIQASDPSFPSTSLPAFPTFDEKPIKGLQLSSTAASKHAIWQGDGKQPVLMQVCQHLQAGPKFIQASDPPSPSTSLPAFPTINEKH